LCKKKCAKRIIIMETFIGSLLKALSDFIHYGIVIYTFCIIIRALISWLSPDPYNPAVQFLYRITDPVYDRMRQLFPVTFSGIDFSPIIIICVLQFIDLLSQSIIGGISSSLLGAGSFQGTHVVAYVFVAIAGIIRSIIWVLTILFIIRAVLSFIDPDPYNPIVQFIYRATEPCLEYFRSRLPLVYENFDLSPLLVLLLLFLLKSFLLSVLYSVSSSILASSNISVMY